MWEQPRLTEGVEEGDVSRCVCVVGGGFGKHFYKAFGELLESSLLVLAKRRGWKLLSDS